MTRKLLPALAACALLGACAAAPTPTPVASPAVTTAVAAPSTDPLANLRDFTLADLKAASADAHANNDQAAWQCYDFLAVNLPALPGAQAGQTVGAILAFQKARDIVNGASSQSGFLKQINLACAPLVNDVNLTLAKLGILAAGTAATGGAAAPAMGALGAVGQALPIPLTLP